MEVRVSLVYRNRGISWRLEQHAVGEMRSVKASRLHSRQLTLTVASRTTRNKGP